ncbi:MAG: 30S ribosomal protein S18 [Deltaproteobacteria bacterium]|nr:30S ribosomal protein S18 [Deltaproteobacteria bacterium]
MRRRGGSGGGGGGGGGGGRSSGGRKKAPPFTIDADFIFEYKDPQKLRYFITDRGKIVPRRISGLSAKQQRQLTVAIKRARNIALLPYTAID